MNERDAKQIGKILIVIAVALCGISLILPWSGFYMNMLVDYNITVDYYPWGSYVYADLEMFGEASASSLDMWSVFYSFNIGSSEIESLTSVISSINMLTLTFFILSFIFCVAALVFGLICPLLWGYISVSLLMYQISILVCSTGLPDFI